MLKSDSHLIYDYLLASRPERFFSSDIVSTVRRQDGSDIPSGSASAALTAFVRRGFLKIVDKTASTAGPHIQRYVYGFDKEIVEPRWSGKHNAVRHRKTGRTIMLTKREANDESLHAKNGGLSSDLLSLAAQIEKIALKVEQLEIAPPPKVDFEAELLKRLGLSAGGR